MSGCAAARETVTGVKARLTEAQNKRRAEEKEVSTVQTRLAKYKDQLLEVKTNREYQAMLHEIETAQNDIKAREDRILETMMESDELSAEVKKAEAELKSIEKEVGAERQALDQEIAALQVELERTAGAREALAREIDRGVLATFETTAKGRKGIAVSEARDGMCTICHVRLRPQVFNEVRRNDSIIQCDSCRRIPLLCRRKRAGFVGRPSGVSAPLSPLSIVAYIDGGARGNPGPAGYGVRVENEHGELIEEFHGFLGSATNNIAEYNGLLAALRYAQRARPPHRPDQIGLRAAREADEGRIPREASRACSRSISRRRR